MKKLNADMKTGNFEHVYLFCGDETFLKRSYKNRMKAAVCGGNDMNLSCYEGKDIDEGNVIDTAESMPFFAEHRLIVIENSGWLKSSHERIAEYLGHINESTVILFIEEEADKRNKVYKRIKEHGYICEMNHPTPKELSSWAAGILAREGRSITAGDMDIFLSRTGNDMERIRTELDKLISYTEGRDRITEEDITAITSETEVGRVFDMVRAITDRKTEEAMALYEDLLALKEPPLRIIFLIARQFNQLLVIKDLLSAGKGRDDIAAAMKLTPYIAGKLIQQVRPYDRNTLLSFVDRCISLEEAVKKGDLPDRLAVELMICG